MSTLDAVFGACRTPFAALAGRKMHDDHRDTVSRKLRILKAISSTGLRRVLLWFRSRLSIERSPFTRPHTLVARLDLDLPVPSAFLPISFECLTFLLFTLSHLHSSRTQGHSTARRGHCKYEAARLPDSCRSASRLNGRLNARLFRAKF